MAEEEVSRLRMLHISDRDLFAAMRLDGPALRGVREAVRRSAWQEAYEAWGGYFAARERPAHTVRTWPRGRDLKATIREAERVVAHEIQGWHRVTFRFGPAVDFNADYGQSGKYGFHYWGWSIPVREAFEATGDPRYARCFDELINQWYEQREKVKGGHRGSSVIWYELGLACRSPVFLDHYLAYRRAGVMGWRTHCRMLKVFLGQMRKLMDFESRGYAPGNWQMAGSWALLIAGAMLPEFREARDWVRVGALRLTEHLDRDFYEDGCHSERAPGYGSWCRKMSQDVLALYEANPQLGRLKRDFRGRVTQMYDWFLSVTAPGGFGFSTNDGGLGRQDDILTQGAEFTGKGRYLWPVRDRVKAAGRVRPAHPGYTSIDDRPSGFAVMRSGWGQDDLYALINYGPYGGGHTHNDLLDFDLFAYGRPLAVEEGRYGAYDNPLDHYFRSPQAHNQIVVNDAPMERTKRQGEDLVWRTGERIDFFSARHRGYEERFGVVIERRIVFIRPRGATEPGYWVVSDNALEGPRRHAYTWYLHSPFRWRVSRGMCRTVGSPGLLVLPADAEEIRHVRQGVGYAKGDGTEGLTFPERHWIGLQKWTTAGASVAYDVALVPFRTRPAGGAVSSLPASRDGQEVGRSTARGVRVERDGATEVAVFSDRADAETVCGDIRLKGRMCILSLRRGRMAWAAGVDCKAISYRGKALFRAGRVRELVEI
ncbi:MAG: hypothetical protein A3F84_02895 [Candidatus Handelsmanbacteria bacterium RIFCSPLOWO2_12_FULL_64_10]|uniref:Uncharacterized protein n=1 Tax=Handelsmanbacteria sp. (strain RIFCSPLOWO2_12_FULL_64_10) TaxID=1817868 RepID=A0A1F6CQ16_HANXR|nr:MAG: hypothetical protein A3F84_02895 [Candidatus Handelsmanbacteria bacterium RIFCSPLOWO2_12_FULL_64_10]